MRPQIVLTFIAIIISICSCRSDFETIASSGKLEFSRDTIYLDTVFTNIGSSTYRLKVYNRSKSDITIPTIKLAKGLNSKYRMTVDGMLGTNGKIFNNVDVLAKDSLYIFIETTANIADANRFLLAIKKLKVFIWTKMIPLMETSYNSQKINPTSFMVTQLFLAIKLQLLKPEPKFIFILIQVLLFQIKHQ